MKFNNNYSNQELNNIYKKVKEKHYIQNCSDQKKIENLHEKALSDIDKSKGEYHPFERGTPNYRKSNYQYKKSIVNGYFEQYNYFPWNKESESIYEGLKITLDLFFQIADLYCKEKFGVGYESKTGLSYSKFYNEKYFLRICYQHFPNSKGYLSIHRDPIGSHQLSAPIVSLSPKKNNGLYYILNDKKINAQSIMDYGDCIYVDQSRLHAIEHDLITERGTEHFLIVVHKYHSDSSFLKSTTK